MPRGHEHISFVCIFERFSGHFFVKFSWNKIVMGQKILVPCLVKDYIFNTKLEKAIIITSKHGTRIFFPITILF